MVTLKILPEDKTTCEALVFLDELRPWLWMKLAYGSVNVHPLPATARTVGLVLSVALITSDQFPLGLLLSQYEHKKAAAYISLP